MTDQTPNNVQVEAERLRLFISSVTDYAIYMLAPDGTVASWNAGAQRFKGYRPEQIIGRHFSQFYTDADRANGRPARALRIAADEGKFEDEGWRVRQDGSQFWASVVIDPIRDEQGTLLGYTKITRDITERRQADEALHASQEQFRVLVQGVSDYAIYMLSDQGLVTNWNEGARRIKGYASEEVIGTHFSRFYTEEERAGGKPMRALQTARDAGRFETEGWRVRKDGSRFWAHVVIDPVFNPAGQLLGYAKVTRDETERRSAEESLAKAKEALLQAQKLEAIGKLTGGIAHDFNNLLSVIINGIDLLRLTDDRSSHLKTIDSMERAAERGARLTQQLLAFARQQPLKPERLQVNSVLSSFEAVLRRAIPSSVELALQLAPELPEILADGPQLEAALLNLVVNARDAVGRTGSITISTELAGAPPSASTLPAGPYVTVTVRDSGSGMPPEVVARAVEPFFTTKDVGKGTGLGLSQVYGLVQQASGDLRICSEPGQGTAIALYFPAQESRGGAASAAGAEKALVVDDQPEVLGVAVQLFSSLGYEVLSANNGKEALAIMRRHPDVAILFSDIVMPDMNGVELAHRVRAVLPQVKILLASGYAPPQEIGDAPFALLQKPYRLSDIIRKLKTLH